MCAEWVSFTWSGGCVAISERKIKKKKSRDCRRERLRNCFKLKTKNSFSPGAFVSFLRRKKKRNIFFIWFVLYPRLFYRDDSEKNKRSDYFGWESWQNKRKNTKTRSCFVFPVEVLSVRTVKTKAAQPKGISITSTISSASSWNRRHRSWWSPFGSSSSPGPQPTLVSFYLFFFFFLPCDESDQTMWSSLRFVKSLFF